MSFCQMNGSRVKLGMRTGRSAVLDTGHSYVVALLAFHTFRILRGILPRSKFEGIHEWQRVVVVGVG